MNHDQGDSDSDQRADDPGQPVRIMYIMLSHACSH